MREGPASLGPTGEERAGDALVHLQHAALEFIAAARVLLDVAEEAVREPAGLAGMVSETLGGLFGAVAHQAPPGSKSGGDGADGSRSSRSGSTVEHIRIT